MQAEGYTNERIYRDMCNNSNLECHHSRELNAMEMKESIVHRELCNATNVTLRAIMLES